MDKVGAGRRNSSLAPIIHSPPPHAVLFSRHLPDAIDVELSIRAHLGMLRDDRDGRDHEGVSVLTKEAARELLESVVARNFGASQNALDVFPKLWLSPVVASRLLGARGVAFAGCLQKHLRGDSIVRRIVPGREAKVLAQATGTGILVYERARHFLGIKGRHWGEGTAGTTVRIDRPRP